MRHFSVDTRTISKKQFKALKAAAKAAGLDVTYWRWSDRGLLPIMSTQSFSGKPVMRMDWGAGELVHVNYAEALRRLAESGCAEKPRAPMTPAQEAGFEVGDNAVVIEEDVAFGLGSIVRLEVDDDSEVPEWKLIDGDCGSSDGIAYADLRSVRKLTNVKEA